MRESGSDVINCLGGESGFAANSTAIAAAAALHGGKAVMADILFEPYWLLYGGTRIIVCRNLGDSLSPFPKIDVLRKALVLFVV